jgi:tetratricopeptide (TPR) repeat protein
MEKIHFLLRNLSKAQVKMLKDYLHYFSIRKDPDTQLMKLAEIVLSSGDEVPSIEDCSQLIYGKMNYNGIQKLKSRLQKKIENLLLLDMGTEKRDKDLDEGEKFVIIIRRKVALFHILLLYQGENSRYLKTEMDEIIRLSKKYELYSVLIEQLKYKKWIMGFKEGEMVMRDLNKEIDFYQRCDQALNKAVDCYYQAVIKGVHSPMFDKQELQNFLGTSIVGLKNEVAFTKSALVSYYTKLLEVMYYTNDEETAMVRKTSLEVLDICRKNKSVFRRQRLAMAYLYLVQCDIDAGEYAKAVEYAISAKKYSLKNAGNYNASIDFEFHARFYQSDLQNSQRLSQELLRSVKPDPSDFLFAKYLYYQACVYYAQKKYKEALRVLNLKLKISKDRQGWDMSIRILKIQAFVELGRLDEASAHVAALLKHAERSFVDEELKPRERLILRTFRMLEHEGFSGSRVKAKIEKSYNLLCNHKQYRWKPLSSELIPIEKWIASRYKPAKQQLKASAA